MDTWLLTTERMVFLTSGSGSPPNNESYTYLSTLHYDWKANPQYESWLTPPVFTKDRVPCKNRSYSLNLTCIQGNAGPKVEKSRVPVSG